MFERFTHEARRIVKDAVGEARRLGHTNIGTEHLLLALSRHDVGMAGRVLGGLGITHDDVERTTVALVGVGPEELGPADAHALELLGIDLGEVRRRTEAVFGAGALNPRRKAGKRHLPFTRNGKKVLELSLRESLALGHKYIGPEHILLGLIRCSDLTCVRVLRGVGVAPETIRSEVLGELRRAS
jgi:ATP-dependent Clp protease ATP-binding subunit ClpA